MAAGRSPRRIRPSANWTFSPSLISSFSPFIVRIPILASFLVCASVRAQMIPAQSIVYSAHDQAAINQYQPNSARVRAMVNRLVLAVTGERDLARAWGSLVSLNDKIGIKISAAGGELFTTHHDVVNAIVDGLVAAGHARGSIIVWDRSLGGIKDAGYRPGADGYQLKAIAPREGYDPKAVISAPLIGQLVWGDLDYRSEREKIPLLSDTENTSNVRHFSKVI